MNLKTRTGGLVIMALMTILTVATNSGCGSANQEPARPQQQVAHTNYPLPPVVIVPPATPVDPVTSPVQEMFKGQAAYCAKAAPHSTGWDMQSCDDLERIKRGEKPANDTDDWMAKQQTPTLEAWFLKQTINKTLAPKLLPIGKKTVLAGLRSPSAVSFSAQNIALQCPDTDTFIAVYGVEGKNVFNAEVHDTVCVGIGLKESRGVIVECGALVNIRFALENDDRESVVTNLRLLCELPAKLLKL